MEYSFSDHQLGSTFKMETNFTGRFFERSDANMILWNRSPQEVRLKIDHIPVLLKQDELTTLTPLQNIEFTNYLPLTVFSFNKPFYCVHTNDQEISCNGFLFYGTTEIPIIHLPTEEVQKFDLLQKVFEDEFTHRDNIQQEMLRMLLKRLIIKITRLAREQITGKDADTNSMDLIRQFNQLVDQHFKTHKQVVDYAEMLFKSPKTLSNAFSKYHKESPLSVIHKRIILEAKKLLYHTNLSSKAIALELGFHEVSTFHKIFRKVTGITTQQFKKGKMDIHSGNPDNDIAHSSPLH